MLFDQRVITDAETQVISHLITNKSLYFQHAGLINRGIFIDPFKAAAFDAFEKIVRNGEKVDVISIAGIMKSSDAFMELSMMVSGVHYNSEFLNHVLVLNEYRKANQLTAMSHAIQQKISAKEDVFEIISYAQKEITDIASVTSSDDTQISAHLKNMMGIIEANLSSRGITGVPSGFTDVDSFTGGWQNGDLIIIAGTASMGKTSFVVTAARNAAIRFGIPVAIISLEMTPVQLVARMSSMQSGINSKHILQGKLRVDEIAHLKSKITTLHDSKIFIDGGGKGSIDYILSSIHCLVMNHGIRLVIIDYLQLITNHKKGANKEQEIAEIARMCKNKAKELEIPIILLSQLGRDVNKNKDCRPLMSNLRDSGQIEEAADIVAFVYRPEYYGITHDDRGNSTHGKAELIIAKGRNIGIAAIDLGFKAETTEFHDLVPQEFENNYSYGKPNF